jgi:hypothetical protein
MQAVFIVPSAGSAGADASAELSTALLCETLGDPTAGRRLIPLSPGELSAAFVRALELSVNDDPDAVLLIAVGRHRVSTRRTPWRSV